MPSYSAFIEVRGYRIAATFDYTPPCKGEREAGTGLQLSPDEPAQLEVTGMKLLDPEDIFEIITEEVIITIEDVTGALEKKIREREE